MVDQRDLLVRLELHLNRGSGSTSGCGIVIGFAGLPEQHPARRGLFGHLLDHAEAPPGGFQLQNKCTGDHGLFDCLFDCFSLSCFLNQFFALIAAIVGDKAKHDHQQ